MESDLIYSHYLTEADSHCTPNLDTKKYCINSQALFFY